MIGIPYVSSRTAISHQTEGSLLNTLILTKTISIPSIPANIKLVERFLMEIQDTVHLEDSVMDRVMISITEVVNNGIVHGNHSDPTKHVHITCHCYEDRLDFIVSDEGEGFRPDDIPDPLDERNLLKEGGRGVLIVRSMMDKVSFHLGSTGMEIHLSIRRTPD